MHDEAPLLLTGRGLTPSLVESVAAGRPVALAEPALERLAAGRAVVERALAEERPVYGLTTGLGARVGHRLATADLADFSYRTLRGRAHGVGPELPRAAVRALMLVRLNGVLNGGAGLSPHLARLLAAMLNRDLRPVVPSIGSLGAGDLCLLAHLGLAVIGEGEARLGDRRGPAADLLAEAGLAPGVLGPKDGLALCNASSVSAGIAALALARLQRLADSAQAAAALSMEAFRAATTPLLPAASAARPQPGQAAAAATLRRLLDGGRLLEPGQARRLQDPISIRCVAPVHGALQVAIGYAEAALDPELNGAVDNPLILPESGEVFSTGNFHTPLLALALDGAALAAAQTAGVMLARTSRLVQERFSGLPNNLTTLGAGWSGFAPVMKIGESLLGEIRHLALPVSGEMRWGADGVEDDVTHTPLAAKKLLELTERLALLLALELLAAAQAVELARPERLGPAMTETLARVRAEAAPLQEDRPLGGDLARLAAAVEAGRFAGLGRP